MTITQENINKMLNLTMSAKQTKITLEKALHSAECSAKQYH